MSSKKELLSRRLAFACAPFNPLVSIPNKSARPSAQSLMMPKCVDEYGLALSSRDGCTTLHHKPITHFTHGEQVIGLLGVCFDVASQVLHDLINSACAGEG